MKQHPYKALPDHAFWSRSVARPDMGEVDPVLGAAFEIAQSDKVATAGSCFAQHIARHLKRAGFNYYVAEPAHPITPAELATTFNYGVFSARYANIYTARQLLQLLQRVYAEFRPQDDVWRRPEGGLLDPFRPQIQPGGFLSTDEYEADRAWHFKCVREMFEQLDVFVFTLGLTEAWVSAADGAVYPLCPGVAGGDFDDSRHRFVNFSVDEVRDDMLAFIDRLRAINRKAKVILTVSPVPLVATAAGRHVLVSTTYSKAVLRVAAEQVVNARTDTVYFPSYEIVTGIHARGKYFADDLRSVTEQGVNHVMRLFFRHFTDRLVEDLDEPVASASSAERDEHTARMAELAEVNCDEVALEAGL